MNKPKLNDEKAAEILHLLANGMPATELATMYGVSYASIASIREGTTYKHVDGPRPQSKTHLTDKQQKQIILLWNEGKLTAAEIGDAFGRSAACVYNLCKGKSFRNKQRGIDLPEAVLTKKRARKAPLKLEAKKLLLQGKTPAEAMEILQCSVSPVYEARKEVIEEHGPQERQG